MNAPFNGKKWFFGREPSSQKGGIHHVKGKGASTQIAYLQKRKAELFHLICHERSQIYAMEVTSKYTHNIFAHIDQNTEILTLR